MACHLSHLLPSRGSFLSRMPEWPDSLCTVNQKQRYFQLPCPYYSRTRRPTIAIAETGKRTSDAGPCFPGLLPSGTILFGVGNSLVAARFRLAKGAATTRLAFLACANFQLPTRFTFCLLRDAKGERGREAQKQQRLLVLVILRKGGLSWLV